MVTRIARFRQADAKRALRAAQEAGLRPSGFKIAPDGAIIVTFDEGAVLKDGFGNPWDKELIQ